MGGIRRRRPAKLVRLFYHPPALADVRRDRALRYAGWIGQHRSAVLVAALLVAALCGWAASGLKVRANFSTLLPPDSPSVVAMEQMKQRIRAFGSLFLVIEGDTAEAREAFAAELVPRLRQLDAELVANVEDSDGPIRRFAYANRYLLAPMDDLRRARDALAERVKQEKLDANPLYIDLEDEPEPGKTDPATEELDDLRQRLDELEREAEDPSGQVSEDGRLQVITVRATFPASNVGKSERLVSEVRRIAAELEARHPEIEIGLTGNVRTTLAEHESILEGMLVAALVTIALCWIALLLYYRSLLAVMSALWALCVGSLLAFAITRLTIGHLNLATAFLAAIVVGNGINPNLILLARYFEEKRAGAVGVEAVAGAISGALRGTLGAALTAGVAYASLMVTEFRGFRHFGFIGALGMATCWITAFTVLPAALVWLDRRLKAHPEPAIGRLLAALMPRRPGRLAAAGLALAAVAGAATYSYIASDPLELNWGRLRSDNAELAEARAWNRRISREIKDSPNQNLSGRFVIATRSRDDARTAAATLAVENAADPDEPLLSYIRSWTDLVPDARVQEQKREVLAEIRQLIDEVRPDLNAEDAETARRVRPPEKMPAITDDSVPYELAWLFTETDGSRGRVVFSTNSESFRSWNVRDLVRFSDRVRSVELPEGSIVAGQAFVFADMLRAMERDGPLATALALLGSLIAVLVVVGRGRYGAVTFLCAIAGTLGMIALVYTAGVKVNFLDFIALPITVGIGLDYAVNIVARMREDGGQGARHVLATTGGAVFLCSFTTTVGYGSLLLSENAGIRTFGLAAILGEVACMAFAVFLAPALLEWWNRRR